MALIGITAKSYTRKEDVIMNTNENFITNIKVHPVAHTIVTIIAYISILQVASSITLIICTLLSKADTFFTVAGAVSFIEGLIVLIIFLLIGKAVFGEIEYRMHINNYMLVMKENSDGFVTTMDGRIIPTSFRLIKKFREAPDKVRNTLTPRGALVKQFAFTVDNKTIEVYKHALIDRDVVVFCGDVLLANGNYVLTENVEKVFGNSAEV